MKVLLDTNVLLDVLFDREPFSTQAAEVLSRAERGDLSGYACATTLTTIFYLCRKEVGKHGATRHIETLLTMLEVAPVNRGVIESALDSDFTDFEDSVLSESAALVSAQAIVTRNKKDFSKSGVPVYTPGELLNLLDSQALPGQGA
ncbi:MAG: PIN domain-containing protein [Planctomycetota bacterium]|nr:PIN domain-containing protein [Planctomycetota bacterium]